MKKLSAFAAGEHNPKWKQMIARERALYLRENDVRSPFLRDYTRAIHCTAFRRLKHKTQVFFSPQSDHICTRIEHVLHVESISCTIADSLGLNTELTRSIAVAHDLGHSPFGHKGEKVLDAISREVIGDPFWHEKNSLFIVDYIELLEDSERHKRNLDLTYAVRDGLICHCGEAMQNHLFPREEAGDLYALSTPGKALPFTYEGCVVRMADRISYIGRDIEDAVALGILDAEKLAELTSLCREFTGKEINNTILINHLISDLCLHSDPENGICFSDSTNELLNLLNRFNSKYIYQSPRVVRADQYFQLVIRQIFDLLFSCFDEKHTLENLQELKKLHPMFAESFLNWLATYWTEERDPILENPAIFDLHDRTSFAKAVLSYIAGMSDKYAMDCYHDIISF